MAQPDEPGSPTWWLRRLHQRIALRRPALAKLSDYYYGRHPLGFASRKFSEAFGGLFSAWADNFCQLVVDSVDERLTVQGIRVPNDAGDLEPDRELWRVWQANDLDALSSVAHVSALLHGVAYACVWPSDDPAVPDVTIEHAGSAVVEVDPKRPRRRLAGLRLYADAYGYEHAELMLPDAVYLYRSRTPRDIVGLADASDLSWQIDTNLSPDGRLPNPFGVVPLVEFTNRPRLFTGRPVDDLVAGSELAIVMPMQDAINKLLADMLVASEFAAYPQRWLTGFELERDPDTGQALPLPFSPTSKVWALEDPDARFGAFPAAQLDNYVKAIELVVQHIASATRTPPHYLNGSADRLSGESVKAAESGLVAKVKDRQVQFGNAWEETARLIGRAIGDERVAGSTACEVIWADPESRTEAQHVDATVKLAAIGLPNEYLWQRLGLTPQEIDRVRAMQTDDAFLAAISAPAVGPLPEPAPVRPAVVTGPGTFAPTLPTVANPVASEPAGD